MPDSLLKTESPTPSALPTLELNTKGNGSTGVNVVLFTTLLSGLLTA
ncbi:hypothetical protein [Paenibacillus sp. CFBP13512]|nr:hypothetical protein [Paenibacillus sp. CFBP13512]